MRKTILITGATDGIGLETAKTLASDGHHLIIHGRNRGKLTNTKIQLSAINEHIDIDLIVADLSVVSDVIQMAKDVILRFPQLDVLINNAGVFKSTNTKNEEGLDIRFVVNTIAPFCLSEMLAPLLGETGRIVNLSSAAQTPVNIQALLGNVALEDMQAYAQSKRAIRLFTTALSKVKQQPTMISVNPGSLLASKMVTEGFGIVGNDLSIGSRIVCKIATDDDMPAYNGQYFDNDNNRFATDIDEDEAIKLAKPLIEALNLILADYR